MKKIPPAKTQRRKALPRFLQVFLCAFAPLRERISSNRALSGKAT